MTTIIADHYPKSSDSGISNSEGGCSIYKISQGSCGFTLIEILITLLVLTIGIFALARLQTVSVKGNSKARQMMVASNLATNQAEQLANLDFEDPQLEPGDHGPQQCDRYWIGWRVTSDVPFKALNNDTDGQGMDDYHISKTINIIMFNNNDGFDVPMNLNHIVNISLIKTRSI